MRQELKLYMSLTLTCFDPGPVHVRFELAKVTLQQIVFRLPWFSPVSVIPQMLHTHFHFNATYDRRASGQSLKTFIENKAVTDRKHFHILHAFMLQRDKR
jgi:hypothetical protein